MDLLDVSKIDLLKKRTAILNEEIQNLQQNLPEVKAIAHNKDTVSILQYYIPMIRLMNFTIMLPNTNKLLIQSLNSLKEWSKRRKFMI